MELDVKAVIPSASGWKTRDGETYVTNWSTSILLHQDIWMLLKDEPKVYFAAPLEGGYTLYMNQDVDSGYSNFYLDDPTNHRGFGGREFELDMYDGETVTLKGPWSSNSGVVNRAIRKGLFLRDPQFEYVQEVTFYSHHWRSVGLAASLSIIQLGLLVKEYLGHQWHLAWVDDYVKLHAPESGSCKGTRIT